jgi:hypothetical protein
MVNGATDQMRFRMALWTTGGNVGYRRCGGDLAAGRVGTTHVFYGGGVTSLGLWPHASLSVTTHVSGHR